MLSSAINRTYRATACFSILRANRLPYEQGTKPRLSLLGLLTIDASGAHYCPLMCANLSDFTPVQVVRSSGTTTSLLILPSSRKQHPASRPQAKPRPPHITSLLLPRPASQNPTGAPPPIPASPSLPPASPASHSLTSPIRTSNKVSLSHACVPARV